MPDIQLIRKSILPFAKMRVEVGGQQYLLGSLKSKQILLPEGSYEVKMRLEGWYGTNEVQIEAHTTKLVIQPLLPDIYYALGIVTTIAFFQLYEVSPVLKWGLGIVSCLIILSIFYFTFIKDKHFYTCKAE